MLAVCESDRLVLPLSDVWLGSGICGGTSGVLEIPGTADSSPDIW